MLLSFEVHFCSTVPQSNYQVLAKQPLNLQVHCDWFPGLGRLVRDLFGSHTRLVQGIEHARRNMARNNSQGSARARGILPRLRPRRARGRGRGRAGRGRARHGRGAQGRGRQIAEQPQEPVPIPPHLTSRGLHVFLAYFYESVFIPSILGFSLFWRTCKLRMEEGWGERIWSEYFFGQHMRQETFHEQRLWGASWHAGSVGRHEPGLAPSQQTAEQAWRMLKRGLRAMPIRTHLDLANRIETLMRHWSAPLPDTCSFAQNKRRAGTMSLMPVGRDIALARPPSPHDWMLSGDGLTVRRPGGLQQYFPSIRTIIQKAQLRGGVSVRRLERGRRTFMCMSVGKPKVVPPDLLQKMLDQINVRTEADLSRLWVQEGFIVDDEQGGPPRINLTAYRSDAWTDHFQRFSCHGMVLLA